MSLNDWRAYKLGDIAQLRKEQVPPNGVVQSYIGLEHIEQQTLRLKGIGSSSEVISNKYRFYEGDILFGKLRPYFRKVYNPKFGGVCSTDIFVIKNKEDIDKTFLFYLIASEAFTQLAYAGNTGTRMPRADWSHLITTDWLIPEKKEVQKNIGSILSSLDEKIELNLQTNQTLEAITQTLFRELCVTKGNELPQGWKETSFEEEFDAERGLSYKGVGLAESEGVPMHNLNSIYEGGGFKTEGVKYYTGAYKEKNIVKPGDVIVANTEQGHKYRLIGFPAIVPRFFGDLGIYSHHIYRLTPKRSSYLTTDFAYHLLLRNEVREQVIGFANGTTVNMLKVEGLKKPTFRMPPKDVVEKFTAIAKSNRLLVEANIEENQTLTALRDSLLPKLMKGEIEV